MTDYDVLAARDARILERFSRGVSITQIAFEERVERTIVGRVIKAAADELRDKIRSRIEQSVLAQDTGLTALIARCWEAIDRAANHDPPMFDKDAVKSLLLVYERQAKLLGLDRARGGKDDKSWMRDGAGEEELKKRARELGIKLPAPIADA